MSEHDITLRLGDERSLPRLLAGVPAHDVKLIQNGDGSYTLQITGTIGQARDEGRLTASDFFVEAFNRFIEKLDEAPIPDHVAEALGAFHAEWMVYNGGGTHTPANAYKVDLKGEGES